MRDYDKYEEMCVVEAGDVHNMTLAGWMVVEVLRGGDVRNTVQEVPLDPSKFQAKDCPNCNSYHSCYQHTGMTSPDQLEIHGSIVLPKPLFLMGRKKDPVMDALRAQHKCDQETIANQAQLLETKTAEVVEVANSRDSAKRSLREVRKQRDKNHADVVNLQDANRKLEDDLVRARQFVGERSWQEHVIDKRPKE